MPRHRDLRGWWGVLLLAAGLAIGRAAAAPILAGPPRRVVIQNYDDHAMEPFVSRDGRYLLFNSLNEPPAVTNIRYAERVDDFTWIYRGDVRGVNTPYLEGCPSLDRAGNLYFVSTRSYPQTFCTLYTGHFQAGAVTGIHLVDNVSRREPGWVNFDVDVSPDGQLLVFVDSRFGLPGKPNGAELVLARWDGRTFVRLPASRSDLQQVNAGPLQYAPAISADHCTLFFTRFDPQGPYAGPQVYRAVRRDAAAVFGVPERLAGLGEYVEGPAFSPDERLLYFHRRDNGRFHLYAVPLRPDFPSESR